jgi:nucleoside-diphosphate-sugar epimerase
MKEKKILLTGASGYIASDLIYRLNSFQIIGVDLINSENVLCHEDIASKRFKTYIEKYKNTEFIVINLAAARFDFGATADQYYKLNVECHEKFLENISNLPVSKFIHISSVAAIDGSKIVFSSDLSCDDAYRSTKSLQEQCIQKWCKSNKIELYIMYPSAVFSPEQRKDTNIGKLQKISQYVPFIPSIRVKKSLTFLPDFSNFIKGSVYGKIKAGSYLTINEPVLTVTDIIKYLSNNQSKIQLKLPFLKMFLYITSIILYTLSLFGKFDLKLMPNRVKKLFSDTSYDSLEEEHINTTEYMIYSGSNLKQILTSIKK